MSYRVQEYLNTGIELQRLQLQASALEEIESSALKRVGLPDAGKVLEVGCGPGYFAAGLARRNPGLSMIGLDVDALCLRNARQRLPVIKGDGRALPLRCGSLDVVYMRLALRHIPNPDRAIASAYLALRPGGNLIIEEVDDASLVVFPEPKSLAHVLAARHESMIKSGGDPFIGRRILALMNGAGFTSIACEALPITTLNVGREVFADLALGGFALPTVRETVPTDQLDELRTSIDAWKADLSAFGMTVVLVYGGTTPH